MMKSTAQTVAAYLDALAGERREPIASLRQLILRHLPAGFEEQMEYGMISYVVPLSRYPKTYNGKPLLLASLASQKQYMSLYLQAVYGDAEIERWFTGAFQHAGKRLDMGKSCVRFKSLSDLPLEVIGDAIARLSVEEYIALYERARGQTAGASRKAATRASSPSRAGRKKVAKKASKKAKRAAKKAATKATRRASA